MGPVMGDFAFANGAAAQDVAVAPKMQLSPAMKISHLMRVEQPPQKQALMEMTCEQQSQQQL
jgi:hypothetical protein